MSQRHIGTYKALTYNNLPTLQLLTKIANYFFNIGIPLTQWTNDLDVSLLKKLIKFDHLNLKQLEPWRLILTNMLHFTSAIA